MARKSSPKKPAARKPAAKKATKKKSSSNGAYPCTAMDKKYEAEDGLRTLRRAEEIRQNKPLMTRIKKVASDEMKAVEKIMKDTSKY